MTEVPSPRVCSGYSGLLEFQNVKTATERVVLNHLQRVADVLDGLDMTFRVYVWLTTVVGTVGSVLMMAALRRPRYRGDFAVRMFLGATAGCDITLCLSYLAFGFDGSALRSPYVSNAALNWTVYLLSIVFDLTAVYRLMLTVGFAFQTFCAVCHSQDWLKRSEASRNHFVYMLVFGGAALLPLYVAVRYVVVNSPVSRCVSYAPQTNAFGMRRLRSNCLPLEESCVPCTVVAVVCCVLTVNYAARIVLATKRSNDVRPAAGPATEPHVQYAAAIETAAVVSKPDSTTAEQPAQSVDPYPASSQSDHYSASAVFLAAIDDVVYALSFIPTVAFDLFLKSDDVNRCLTVAEFVHALNSAFAESVTAYVWAFMAPLSFSCRFYLHLVFFRPFREEVCGVFHAVGAWLKHALLPNAPIVVQTL